ncbi:MAG: hypothetical protein ACI8TP_002933, partial [Acidimicrobiales bacterium]
VDFRWGDFNNYRIAGRFGRLLTFARAISTTTESLDDSAGC